jgi:hypothetical protein
MMAVGFKYAAREGECPDLNKSICSAGNSALCDVEKFTFGVGKQLAPSDAWQMARNVKMVNQQSDQRFQRNARSREVDSFLPPWPHPRPIALTLELFLASLLRP